MFCIPGVLWGFEARDGWIRTLLWILRAYSLELGWGVVLPGWAFPESPYTVTLWELCLCLSLLWLHIRTQYKQTHKAFLAQLSRPLPLELLMVLSGRIIATSFESWDISFTFQSFYFICIGFVSYIRLSPHQYLIHYHSDNDAIDACGNKRLFNGYGGMASLQ